MIADPDSLSVPSESSTDGATAPEAENAHPTFTTFELPTQIQKAIADQGYTHATEIQAASIPAILTGRDVVGQAATGTGKTAAFALPVLAGLDLSLRQPQVLVLVPTRELAIQVAEAFETYGADLKKLGVATVYGGQHYAVQVSQLKRGAQVVVGTPGRVMDHMRRGQLSLDALTTLVLDEADEMLQMGFAEDMEWVFSQAPAERQTLLFSATLPGAVQRVAEKYLSSPQRIRAQGKARTAETVQQRVCCVRFRDKLPTLARILEAEPTDGVIVFVKTRETSSRLAEELCQRGYRASALNGDMQQNQREHTIDRLKSGRLDVLVATDVAARGLDVERISHVINYEYPHDAEAYIHRIGRTGRAGRTGHAILLVTPKEKFKVRSLEKFTRQSITWMDRPTMATVRAARSEKLMSRLKEAMAGDLSSHKANIAAFLEAHPESTLEDVAAALAALATSHADDEQEDERGYGASSSRRGSERPTSSGHSRSGKRAGSPPKSWTKYRAEVGYTHGVRPGNIVGAITAESALVGSDIGGIEIRPHFSTIDLPSDLSSDQLAGLRNLKVSGQTLRLSAWETRGGAPWKKGRKKFAGPAKKNRGYVKGGGNKKRKGKRKSNAATNAV